MKKAIFVVVFILVSASALQAQLLDSYSDGDFSGDPVWSGNTADWQIVADSDAGGGATNSMTLRLNVETGSGTSYLSVQRTESWGSEQTWGFWLGRRDQAVTSTNYSIVWLWASEDDLNSSTIDGYRLKFGDNSGGDDIFLQRIDDGVSADILQSAGSVPNGLMDYGFLVRVTRTVDSQWTLFTSTLPVINGTGAVASEIPQKINTLVNQGSVSDDTYTDFTNGYLGFLAGYSTASAARTAAEFDQLYFTVDSDASLPVSLSEIRTAVIENGVKIQWTTRSEILTHGYYVLRADNPDGDYRQISSLIRGAGTSTQEHEYSFCDHRVTGGKTYWYKLEQIDIDGTIQTYGPVKVKVLPEIEQSEKTTPGGLELFQSYPNPFNPGTTITIDLTDTRGIYTTISIFDITGKLIRRLYQGWMNGFYRFNWQGDDAEGVAVPSGVYFCHLETDEGNRATIKLIKLD